MYVIGIDGGGTKTTGVIANETGEIFARATVGATNPNSVERDTVIKELQSLFDVLKTQNGSSFKQVESIFAGMSGAGNEIRKNEIEQIITSLVPKNVRTTVDNDALIALYSGTLGRPGVVQIAGTGSITYGINAAGKRGRVGGWGYLFGDDGSGYAIGRDGLRKAFQAYDRLQEQSNLGRLLCDYFQVDKLPEIVPVIYGKEHQRELIASLSKLVVEAADYGDKVAAEIIHKNGVQLGESITCLIGKLFDGNERVPVVLTGGIFNRLDLFKDSIAEVLLEKKMDGEIIIPKLLPVVGAVIAALKQENIAISPSCTGNFNREGR